MSTRPERSADPDPDRDGGAPAVSLEEYDENRQAGLLTMKALDRLGLDVPINEPLLRERTPGGDEYLVVVPLGPAIGSGGAKVACMMWGVEEDPDDPIAFGIDDRETDTWVEGFPAEEINAWVDPRADSEYETYPIERVGENRFELVATTDFFESYEGRQDPRQDDTISENATVDADSEADESPDGVVEAPDTTLAPDDDPTFY